jgi:hypothetical protein
MLVMPAGEDCNLLRSNVHEHKEQGANLPAVCSFLASSRQGSVDLKVRSVIRLQKYCYDSESRFSCVPATLYCWVSGGDF